MPSADVPARVRVQDVAVEAEAAFANSPSVRGESTGPDLVDIPIVALGQQSDTSGPSSPVFGGTGKGKGGGPGAGKGMGGGKGTGGWLAGAAVAPPVFPTTPTPAPPAPPTIAVVDTVPQPVDGQPAELSAAARQLITDVIRRLGIVGAILQVDIHCLKHPCALNQSIVGNFWCGFHHLLATTRIGDLPTAQVFAAVKDIVLNINLAANPLHPFVNDQDVQAMGSVGRFKYHIGATIQVTDFDIGWVEGEGWTIVLTSELILPSMVNFNVQQPQNHQMQHGTADHIVMAVVVADTQFAQAFTQVFNPVTSARYFWDSMFPTLFVHQITWASIMALQDNMGQGAWGAIWYLLATIIHDSCWSIYNIYTDDQYLQFIEYHANTTVGAALLASIWSAWATESRWIIRRAIRITFAGPTTFAGLRRIRLCVTSFDKRAHPEAQQVSRPVRCARWGDVSTSGENMWSGVEPFSQALGVDWSVHSVPQSPTE